MIRERSTRQARNSLIASIRDAEKGNAVRLTRHDTAADRFGAKRQLKGDRRVRELELLNRHAKELNAEGDENADYQTSCAGSRLNG